MSQLRQVRRRQIWRLIDRVNSPTAGLLPDTRDFTSFDVLGLRQPTYVLLRWLYIPEDISVSVGTPALEIPIDTDSNRSPKLAADEQAMTQNEWRTITRPMTWKADELIWTSLLQYLILSIRTHHHRRRQDLLWCPSTGVHERLTTQIKN